MPTSHDLDAWDIMMTAALPAVARAVDKLHVPETPSSRGRPPWLPQKATQVYTPRKRRLGGVAFLLPRVSCSDRIGGEHVHR